MDHDKHTAPQFGLKSLLALTAMASLVLMAARLVGKDADPRPEFVERMSFIVYWFAPLISVTIACLLRNLRRKHRLVTMFSLLVLLVAQSFIWLDRESHTIGMEVFLTTVVWIPQFLVVGYIFLEFFQETEEAR